MLEYKWQGDGDKCVVFLHGWGGSLVSFGYFAKIVANKGCRVLNVSFSGHGASPPPDGAWGIADYVRPLVELMDSLGIGSATIIGHSFGGRAAIYMAANHPNRVDRLVLIDSAGILPKRGIGYKYRVWRYKRAKAKGKDLSSYGSDDYRALTPNIRESFVRVVNEDLEPTLGRINIPTLLVWGDKDKDTPLYMAKRLQRGIKDSGLVTIKGAGHYSYVDRADIFLGALLSFLGV